MSGFSGAWLALRAAADERARWLEGAQAWLLALSTRPDLPLMDLACGTGANCRYLAPLLPTPREWWLVDHDAALLAEARGCAALPGVRGLRARELDLARHDTDLALGRVGGLTASALLDLVSDAWLERLVTDASMAGLPLLFALTYDGRISLSPQDPDDEWIRSAVNAHQRGDKGFGPALGPAATDVATALLQARGYRVRTAASDWILDAARTTDAALLGPLLRGWADAAAAMAGAMASASPRTVDPSRWLERREHAVARGALRVQVGHRDLLALI